MGSSASNNIFPYQLLKWPPYYNTTITKSSIISFAAPTASLLPKSCRNCGGKGAIDCPGCKGTGKNKKNGNIFERWKCFDCQGFGLKSCPECGKGGLTPNKGEKDNAYFPQCNIFCIYIS
ncbi:unnamed protein product [Citrullus colocynthis]|uniref:Uncharacterized protein n=1 Tax=Citrullus colocynthis TaxID=252529 RepID=A0ABP0XLF8_9ROSI